MPLSPLSPQDAQALLARGAILIDIRDADEYAREHIPGARHLPLAQVDPTHPAAQGARVLIYHCRSGNRSHLSRRQLAERSACEAYVLEGGLDAWKRAGLPVARDARQPLELQRQVQIAAGALILLGTLLGVTVSPWLLAVPAFFGAGFIFAGLTGFCGLARLLLKMPWNRKSLAVSSRSSQGALP